MRKTLLVTFATLAVLLAAAAPGAAQTDQDSALEVCSEPVEQVEYRFERPGVETRYVHTKQVLTVGGWSDYPSPVPAVGYSLELPAVTIVHVDYPDPFPDLDNIPATGVVGGLLYRYVHTTTVDAAETTEWVTEPPAGDGWVLVDERTVELDVEAGCPTPTTTTEPPSTSTTEPERVYECVDTTGHGYDADDPTDGEGCLTPLPPPGPTVASNVLAAAPAELAHTGANRAVLLTVLGAAAILLGTGACMLHAEQAVRSLRSAR
jgi:hypothetical protein